MDAYTYIGLHAYNCAIKATTARAILMLFIRVIGACGV